MGISPTYALSSAYRQTSRAGRVRAGTGRAIGIASLSALMLFSGVIAAGTASADPAAAPIPTPASCPVVVPTVVTTTGNVDGVFNGTALRAAQVDTAATIVKVGKDLGITDRGIRIALAVAMDASSLTPTVVNTPFVGLYQQKSDAASGLYEDKDRADATGAVTMFYDQLVKRIPGYDTDSRADWELGEAVQESGHGKEFDQWSGLAAQLLIKITTAPQVEVADAAAQSTSVAPANNRNVPARYLPAAGFSGSINLNAPMPALRGGGVAFSALDTTGSGTEPTDPATSGDADGAASTGSTTADSSSTDSTGTDPTGTDPTDTESPSDPGTTDPTGTEPTGTEPTTSDPGTTEPGTSDPGTSDPGSTEPGTTEPGTTEPGTTEPGTTEPGTTEPGTTDPTTSVPTTPTTPVPTTTPTPTSPGTSTPVPTPTPTPAPIIPADNIGGDGAVIVPELPEPPVPTGTDDDPQVSDTPPAGGGNSNGSNDTPSGPPAVLDCAPSTNGGSTTFDPGEIISDAVFYNSAAMSVDQVDAFIQEKGAACEGDYCLKNLKVTTPNVPADKYCAAYTGGTEESAAAVIAKVSVACKVNPQVMLVTLQKESALVTKTSPTLSSYNAAWGWHCPDTGPGGTANCDPAHAGFFNQAFGMAKQWARYVVDPLKYNYQAGETTEILWNVVESGCGGAPVTIRNTATASLYNYTPYQPNEAALGAYPGVGDKCSTYGNRNFFFLFQKYFGVTGGGAPAYVVVNGVDVTIPAGPHVAAGAAGQVIKAPNAAVAKGIAAGLASIGLPYVWGGGSNNGAADQGCSRGGGSLNSCQGTVGFDCSGLTGFVLAQAGFTTGTNSAAQRSAGTSVPWQQALAGDIIGYSGHVAIYLGKINGVDYLLEAPAVGMYVQVRPVYMTNNGVAVDNVLHRYWS